MSRGVLIAVGGAFLAFLDTTIVNIAFPDIAASFPEASRGELSWVLDAYFVVIAALLVPAGGVADRIGARRLFLIGLAGFVLTSILCALAPSWQLLVAARALQGISAAVIAPTSLALVLMQFPAERRSAGVGLWGAGAALAAAVGPTAGGAIVEAADWRLIFLVNVPLGLGLLIAGRRALAETTVSDAPLPDLAGAALSAAGLGLLALGIVEGPSWGWLDARTLGCFTAAAIAGVVVTRRSAVHPRPIVDPALMRIASFRRGNLGSLLFAMAFFATILGNVLFLTSVWRYSILDAGLATLPAPLLSTVFAGPAGRLADRFGHRAVIVPGTVLFAAGLLVFRTAGAEPDYLGTWLPGAALTGIGVGLAFPTLGAAAVSDVAVERFATASAVNAAFRQIGAALGTAILVAILGEPSTLASALSAAGDSYLFGVFASLAAGAVALLLAPARATAPVLSAPACADG
jgi:EmrB/QacA subfamily drug resistance transporter